MSYTKKANQQKLNNSLAFPICKEVEAKLVSIEVLRGNEAPHYHYVKCSYMPIAPFPEGHEEVFEKLVEKKRMITTINSMSPNCPDIEWASKSLQKSGMSGGLLNMLVELGVDLEAVLPPIEDGQYYCDVDPGYKKLNSVLQQVANNDTVVKVKFTIAQKNIKDKTTGVLTPDGNKRNFYPQKFPKVMAPIAPAEPVMNSKIEEPTFAPEAECPTPEAPSEFVV